MKVLILTGNTGGGHNSTALNIQDLCEKNGIETKIFDIVVMEEDIQKVLNNSLYDKVIKYVPDLYRLVYKSSNNDLVKLLSRMSRPASNALFEMINEYKPDVIVSAHPISVQLIKRFRRKKYEINTPVVQIVTDFHPHKVYIDSCVDAYITGSDYTNFDIAKYGIPIYKTYSYGIPIKDKFISEYEIKHTNTILIMLGSMGFASELQNIYELLDKDKDRKYLFVTGSNKSLKEELEKKYEQKILDKKLEVFGFVNNVDELMKQSDLVITKPGGLSLSECINLKKPMILVNPIPGQEEENLKIMEIYGAAVSGVDKNLYELVESIYSNDKNLEIMKEGLRRITYNYSKDKILQLIKTIKK